MQIIDYNYEFLLTILQLFIWYNFISYSPSICTYEVHKLCGYRLTCILPSNAHTERQLLGIQSPHFFIFIFNSVLTESIEICMRKKCSTLCNK